MLSEMWDDITYGNRYDISPHDIMDVITYPRRV